jgi:hypothetical protein
MSRSKRRKIYISDTKRNALAKTGARLGREFWQMPDDVALDRYLYAMTQQLRENQRQRQVASGELDVDNLHSHDDWDGSSAVRHRLQNICRNLYIKDPIARNIINNHLFFVLGDGPTFNFGLREPDKPHSPVERAHKRFETFRRVNDFDRQLKTAITMTLAMGEYFLIEPQIPDDEEARDFVRKHGILGVRGLEATHVEEIQIDPFDLISAQKYMLNHAHKALEVPGDEHRELEAERVLHMKINAFGIHGRPILEPVVHYILRANDMLEDRVAISNTRARLPVIREIRRNVGAPARELPERGTVLTVPMDRERWNFPSLAMSSSDFDPDLSAIYLAIAQGVGLPEMFVTMDLSRAGAFGQLAPVQVQLQRLFESYQRQIEPVLADLAHRVCPWIDPDEIRVDFPVADFSTEQMLVDLATRKLQSGLISKRMAIAAIGEDPERVLEELKQEQATQTPAPSAGMGLGGGSAMGSSLFGSDLGLSGGLGGSQFTAPTFPSVSAPSSIPAPSPASAQSPTGYSSIPVKPQSQPAAPPATTPGAIHLSDKPSGIRITSSMREADGSFNRIYAGMDFGWDMPGAVVILGELPDGRLVVLEELVKSEMQLLHAREPKPSPRDCCWVCTLKDLDAKYGLDGVYTDPKDPEAVSVMQEHFNIPVKPVSIPVADGVQHMSQLARDGRLLINHNCPHLLHDTQQGKGHALDALRYSTTAMMGE